MLQISRTSGPAIRRRCYDRPLGAAYMLAWRAQGAVSRGLQRVQLRSRRGEGNAIWTILVVSLVAVVAALALFPIGQRMIQMGQQAASQLQQPPW